MNECKKKGVKKEDFINYKEKISLIATGTVGREIFRLEEELSKALSLIDGAYEVVELFKPSTPAQVEWKKDWLTLAAQYFKCDVVHNFKEGDPK